MRRDRSSRAVRLAAAAAVATAPLVLLSGAAVAQEAPTWSQFQGGPGHPGVLADGPEPPYRVRWTLPAPKGDALSGVVVAGDLAVSVGNEAVYGIDVASGTIEWRVPRHGGPLSIPAIGAGVGGRILVFLDGPGPSDAGGASEGSPSQSAEPSGSPSTTGPSPSPTGPDEQPDVSTLVAVSLADRTELWRTSLGATSRSGVTIEGANAFVGDQSGTVYAVSLESGTITWSEEMDGRVDSGVAVADGQVIAVARNTDTAQVVVAAFDESTGERSWPAQAIQANSTAGTAPSAGDGSLFIGSADRRVRALDTENGTERWATLALSLFSPATSLAFDDDDVFAADIAGGLYRLDAAGGGRRWSYQLNEVVLRSSPVVSGSSVLLGLGDGRLVAVDVASGHLVWESAPSAGLIGTIALSSEAVIAVKGGRDAGLIAFEHDPQGALVDVPSPTQLQGGTTLTRWALAAVIVFAVAFVPGIWATRRFSGVADDEPGHDGSDRVSDPGEGP
ncbi:MAG TPA: PQQ-binding-like beta-propeller repeat protein [Actinomycetota bacterium]|nr:PQQ-binding-like beta-propeller repeat protein [Actinomycetota bacterium]